MCRMVHFEGPCLLCGKFQLWDELTQQLLCLEAKNNGQLGHCVTGVFLEAHTFEEYCPACADAEAGDGVVIEEGHRLEKRNRGNRKKHRS